MFELWKKVVIFNFYAVKSKKGDVNANANVVSYSVLTSDSTTFASHYSWSKIVKSCCDGGEISDESDSHSPLDAFVVYRLKRSECKALFERASSNVILNS